jgi:serine/threonine protein kinase
MPLSFQTQLDPHSAFGVTFKGRYHNKDVAIKKTRLQGDNDYFLLSSWADEVRKLERLNDQNIAAFIGVVEEKVRSMKTKKICLFKKKNMYIIRVCKMNHCCLSWCAG